MVHVARPIYLTSGRNGAEGSNVHEMTAQPEPPPKTEFPPSAIERAIAAGIDANALIENLRLTPTERLRRAQQRLDAILAGKAAAEVWTLEKQILELEALLELRKRPPE